jgi:hypothetical protein
MTNKRHTKNRKRGVNTPFFYCSVKKMIVIFLLRQKIDLLSPLFERHRIKTRTSKMMMSQIYALEVTNRDAMLMILAQLIEDLMKAGKIDIKEYQIRDGDGELCLDEAENFLMNGHWTLFEDLLFPDRAIDMKILIDDDTTEKIYIGFPVLDLVLNEGENIMIDGQHRDPLNLRVLDADLLAFKEAHSELFDVLSLPKIAFLRESCECGN